MRARPLAMLEHEMRREMLTRCAHEMMPLVMVDVQTPPATA